MPETDPNARSLDAVLDALVDSYREPGELNNLETWALPNRRAVVQAYTHLLHLLYLGFFSTRSLDQGSLRLALGEHLLAATELLCSQIGRAAAWEDRNRPSEQRRPDGWSRDRVHVLLERLPALRRTLKGDVEAAYHADPAAESLEDVVFSYPGIFAITAYRIAHVLYEAGVPMVPRILTEHAHTRTGIDIHPGARIGERFFIDHGTGVVIGATAVLGDDVRLYQGVTLGALSIPSAAAADRVRGRAEKRHPTLEDRVTVYAGSTILGGDTVIGAGSVIGGNVWLTRSVPPGSRILYRGTDDPGAAPR